jgi:diguanylate cyclase (GGDEF)-like protein
MTKRPATAAKPPEGAATADFLHRLQAMVATLDLDEVLHCTLELIAACCLCPAAILLLDDRQHALQLRAQRGMRSDPAVMRRWLQSQGGAEQIRQALTAMAPDTLHARIDCATAAELCAAEEVDYFQGFALRADNHLIGAILLGATATPTDPVWVERALLIARFAAGAVKNALNYGQARLQTITDPLTGLYNKRYFKQALPYEIARAQRYGKPMSLLMIDIDHFKQLNDIHGHPKGDQVLAAMGGTLAEALRSTDFSFRYGGEEFAVILPETRLENAFQVAEHLRAVLQERLSRQLSPCGQGTVTASLGLAAFPYDGASVELLLNHADHCLYKAKQQGRNRVYWEINTNGVSA